MALHVGSRTQKAVRAQLKKMDASRAADDVRQQQAEEVAAPAGQVGATAEQVSAMLSPLDLDWKTNVQCYKRM